MCVRREASLVLRSNTCCALSHAALTSRRRRRQPFLAYPQQTGIGGVRYPGKHLPGRSYTSTVFDSSEIARGQASRSRGISARLSAPAEQHPYNRISIYISLIRSHLSRRVGFRSYTSHMLERTRMFRRERDTMSYVFAIRLFSLDELKSIAHPYMFHG